MYCKALYKKLKHSISKKLLDELEYFDRNYFLENSLCGNGKYSLVDLGNQTCRFCQKQYPEVTFNKGAHVMPALMSASKVLSSFECDNCNTKIFHKYEKDFGEYFSLKRVFQGLPNRDGKIPKHERYSGVKIEDLTDLNIKIDGIDFDIAKKRIIHFDPFKNGEKLKFSPEQDKIDEHKIEIKPYKPINVFKVFLKIGFSLIKKEDLKKFEYIRFFLQNSDIKIEEKSEYKDPTMLVNIRYLKSWLFYPIPIVYLFSKKEKGVEWYADKTLVIFWGKEIYQIPIFSNKNFKYLNQFYTLGLASHPILINPYTRTYIYDKHFLSALENSTRHIKNFSCSRIVKDETITMKLDIKGPPVCTDENFNRINRSM